VKMCVFNPISFMRVVFDLLKIFVIGEFRNSQLTGGASDQSQLDDELSRIVFSLLSDIVLDDCFIDAYRGDEKSCCPDSMAVPVYLHFITGKDDSGACSHPRPYRRGFLARLTIHLLG